MWAVEDKFKELRVEGYKKDRFSASASVMYIEDLEEVLPEDRCTKSEIKEIETMYMGTESEARKRFQMKGQ